MRIFVLAATVAALCVAPGVAHAKTVPVGGSPAPRATPPPVAPRAPLPVLARPSPRPVVVKPSPPPVVVKPTPPPVVAKPTPPPVVVKASPPPVVAKPTPPAVVPQAPPAPVIAPGGLPVTLPPPGIPAPSGLQTFPTGCRDLDITASQSSFLFHSKIYNFHQIKHWCWRQGLIYDERHAWSFDGGSTACFDEIYPANHWTFTWWRGLADSGDFSEERAHVTNCVFHIGDWKEFYPDVKIWAYADGTYKIETEN